MIKNQPLKELKKLIDEWAKRNEIGFTKLEIDIHKEVIYIKIIYGFKKEDLE